MERRPARGGAPGLDRRRSSGRSTGSMRSSGNLRLMRPRIALALTLLAAIPAVSAAQDGAALYKSSCAFCHDGGVPRAPNLEALRAMTPQRILASMETGLMIAMAHNRTVDERRAIAEFASGKSFGATFDRTPAPKAMCTAAVTTPADPLAGPGWSGWGRDAVNTRFQDAPQRRHQRRRRAAAQGEVGLRVPRRSDGHRGRHGRGGRVFVGSVVGRRLRAQRRHRLHPLVFRRRGRRPQRDQRGAASTATRRATPPSSATAAANAYAVDATTGALLWKVKVDEFPSARVTGSPVFHRGRLYVPMASGEEGSGSSAHLRMLQVPRQPRRRWTRPRASRSGRPTCRRADAAREERARHAALGTLGRADLVEPGDRRRDATSSTSPPATTTATRPRR